MSGFDCAYFNRLFKAQTEEAASRGSGWLSLAAAAELFVCFHVNQRQRARRLTKGVIEPSEGVIEAMSMSVNRVH